MRPLFLAGALALVALAASSPPEAHDRAALAAHALDVGLPADVAPVLAQLERAASTPARDAALEGFDSLKPSTIGTSPEVLEVARGCTGLQPFALGELKVASLPQLRAPSWRIIGPNRSSSAGSAARG